MKKINLKHTIIGLVLGVLIALFIAGEVRERHIGSDQDTQARADL
ncbi:MAG: hypothetical protein R6V62_03075 [Candidatus Fermentibacteraceae bacterium]